MDIARTIVKFFQKSTDVFDNVDIKGGITYTYYDASINFGEIGFFSSYEELKNILTKVEKHDTFKYGEFASLVSSQGLYKFTDTVFEDYPKILNVQGKGTAAKITSRLFEVFPELFKTIKETDDSIQMLGVNHGKREYRWIKKE